MAPFNPDQAALIRALLLAEKKIRDLALFNTAIDTMLRASDLLPLRVIDITDHNGDVVQEFTIRQKKPGSVMWSRYRLIPVTHWPTG